MIGYLIPEILLMIFSGSLGNWIKGALQTMSKFRAVNAWRENSMKFRTIFPKNQF